MENPNVSMLIIFAPNATNPEVRSAVEKLRHEGANILVRVSWEPDDLTRFIDEAVNTGIDTVIAGGGDGTINAVATALMRCQSSSRPALAILPLGTANDFATSAGIPIEIDNALALAIKGKATLIDLAKVNDDFYFVNMATGGFGTRITTETPAALKSALGGMAYFVNGLFRPDTLKTDICRVEAEDFNWEGETLVIGIGNGRQAGGGQALTPNALVDDGKLDLLLISAREIIPAIVNNLFNPEKNDSIIRRTSSWIKIHSPHKMVFNLDGEPLSGETFRFEILPSIIRCRLPPQCDLLS